MMMIVVLHHVLNFGILKQLMNLIIYQLVYIIKHHQIIVFVLQLILPTEDAVSFEVIYLLIYLFFVVLHLNRNISESQQNISHGNPNDYSLIYKPLPDVPPANNCLIIDINKDTVDTKGEISLQENRCSKRKTSDHIMCKIST